MDDKPHHHLAGAAGWGWNDVAVIVGDKVIMTVPEGYISEFGALPELEWSTCASAQPLTHEQIKHTKS